MKYVYFWIIWIHFIVYYGIEGSTWILTSADLSLLQATGSFPTWNSGYTISESQTWIEANKTCKLATPALSYSSNGFSINFNGDGPLSPGQKVWIGYVKAFTSVLYVGCSDITNLVNQTVAAEINDPDHCLAICGPHNLYGITKGIQHTHKCYCIAESHLNETTLRSKDCKLVSGNPGFVLGSGDGGHVSVYKAVNLNVSDVRNQRLLCLAFYRLVDVGNSFKWEDCSTSYKRLCSSRYYEVNEPGIDTDTGSTEYGEWTITNSECLNQDMFPTSLNSTKHSNKTVSTGASWTGNVRRQTISNIQDTSNIDVISYAYLSRQGASSFYNIGFDNNTEAIRPALCVPGSIQSTKPTTATTPAEHSSSTSANPSISNEVTSITTVSSSEIITDDDRLKSNVTSNSENSSTAGVAAGVSVAIIVAIGVVVGVVVLKKRGIIFTTKSVRRDDEGMVHPDISSPSTLTSTTNTSFKDIVQKESECTSGTEHDYFVLEKQYGDGNGFIKANEETRISSNDYNIYNKIDDEENYAHIDQENTTEGDYNIADAHIIKPVERSKTGNVYNKVNINTGGDYDHVDGRVEPSKATSENDYDTTSAGNLNGSISTGTYDTTDTNHDSPYNHLNDTPLKRSKPDNAYGNPVLADKDGGYGSTSSAEAGNSSYDKVNTRW